MGSRQQIDRGKLLDDLHAFRVLLIEWSDCSNRLQHESLLASEEVSVRRRFGELSAQMRPLKRRYFPEGTGITVPRLEFCINAIQTRQAGSMRAANTQYERSKEEAQDRREMLAEQKRMNRNYARRSVVNPNASLMQQALGHMIFDKNYRD